MAKRSTADAKLLERAEAEVNRLGKFLGLTAAWSILIDIGGLKKEPGAGSPPAAKADWNRHYKKATITYDRDELKKCTPMMLEAYTLHELLHLVFAPMDDELQEQVGDGSRVYWAYADKREGIVDQVSHLLLNARDGKPHVWSEDG